MPTSPQDQTKPTVAADQPTLVSDLSGDAKPGTDVTVPASAKPGTDVTVPASSKPGTEVTRPSDLQDAIPTHANTLPGSGTGTVLSGQTWGDFQFGRLLGKGGMGAVYLGRQLSLDRPVAIKVLPAHLSENEQFRDRFQLEAKAVAKINAPNVIQVYAAGIHQGHHYFAMEYVDGEDLSRKLRHGYRPNHRQALELMVMAARGLAAAGEHGIVHRDIKPGNMMIDRKGQLKIMDFGLVKLASAGSNLTMTGTVMGTVSYFSPEQGRGEACDQRTDIYAIGVVLYELLTGRLPFQGENATSIIYQHIHVAPKLPRELDPTIPEDAQAVTLKCMQKEAGHRYDTAAELLADLERLLAGKPPLVALASDPEVLRNNATVVGTGGMSPTTQVRKPAKPGRGGLAAGIAAAVLAAGGAGWWFMGRAPEAPPATPPPVAPTPAPVAAIAPTPVTPPPAPVAPVIEPQLKAALARIEADNARSQAEQERAKALTQALAQVEGLVADGKEAEADALLAKLATDHPDEPLVQASLKRLRASREQAQRLTAAVTAQIEQGDAALARGDLDAALLAYTAGRQIDPRDARIAAKLAEVERRKAEVRAAAEARATAAASATPATDAQAATAAAALEQARAALGRDDLAEARRLVNVNRGLKADDPHWLELAKALDAAEGRQLLHQAQTALDAGRLDEARKLAAAATALLPDEARQMTERIATAEARRAERERALQEADNLLTENLPGQAETILAQLARDWPDDQQVANALRRAKAAREKAEALAKAIAEQLGQADASLARSDLDAALLSYTAVRQMDPQNAAAAAGLAEVGRRRAAIEAARARLDTAIQAKDEAAATAALDEVKRLAPGAAVAVLAEGALATAKAQWADERRKAEALEQARVAKAAELLAAIDDAQPLEQHEKAVATFLAEAGDRPEKVQLERRLEDRRSRERVAADLGGLDAALKPGADRAALAALVADGAWATALAELAAMPGATFSQSLESFTRDGDAAEARVRIRTSLPEAPEEVLTARYALRREAGAWRITSATLLEQP